MRTPRLTAALAVVLLVVSAPAAGQGVLHVYERGLEWDPSLDAVRFGDVSAREGLRAAWSRFLPSLSFEYDYSHTRQEIRSTDNEVFAQGTSRFPTDEWAFNLVQPVLRLEDWANVPKAKANKRRTEFELVGAQQDLIFRSADAYFGVLASQDNLSFAVSEREAIEAQLNEAEERVGAGLSTVQDLYDAQARFSESLATEADAHDLLRDAQQAVVEIAAEELTNPQSLETQFALKPPEPPNLGKWVAAARDQNPVLRALREEVEVARMEVREKAAEHTPRVDLVGSLSRRDTDGSLFGGGSDVENTDFLVTVSVPLFRAPVILETREKHYEMRRAERELEAERRQVVRDTRAAYYAVNTLITQVDALRRAVEAQQRALESKEEGLRSGLNTGIHVLDARRDLFLAKRDHAQARYDYVLESLRLKQLTGSLDLEDLAEVDRLLQ